MAALTSRSAPSTARGHRAGPRRYPHIGGAPAVAVEALHAEIDNPLDLIAGHQLLTDPAGRRPAAPCDCGHPVCGGHRTEQTRIFLMERHPVASAGLRSVLATVPGLAVVGSTGDLVGAVAAVRRVRPDVILLGRGGSLGDDLAMVAALRGPDGAPEARVLLLRRAESTTEAGRILLAGASGCFPLDLSEDRIIGAVQLAAAGGSVFLPAPPPARVHPASLAGQAAEPPLQQVGLTGRERDVLAQLARGLSNAEIGRELALAEATVKKHLTQAMRKIGQSDRLRAALYAHRHGLAG
ncbi:DNA-binding NarL/FixJ family response regulator [Kitasatospora gansuensis]|uniref:DNA-binding NarL/FixJ family response regulator n=1 Tax=Kitasatospora gansuensis TaxID=258050 RepID=A0A7W7SFB3_9ACTN|nr:response regulator transcription factor [Kitasatospora gansuensis]MBB4949400.1 DNA-binding NarL/FixJ family response regulator [Kitasatospora gansuensis]